jgi:mannitol-1-/sugar-/sorbitol-6-phosphatase
MRIDCTAVLFDLDGVLVDSTAYIEQQWRDWAASKGLDPTPFLQFCHGRRAIETICLAAPQLDAEAEVARFREHAVEDAILPAVPGARELLAALPHDRWGVVTSGARRFALARLTGAGLPQPRVLVSAEDVCQGKPSPEGYVRAAQLLGATPSSCLVVEDAPPGVQAARAAGATVVALTSTHAAAALADAHLIVSSLADLHFILGPNNGRPLAFELGAAPVTSA